MSKRSNDTNESAPDSKERIATCALELFSEKGFAATSVREIAASVALTVPAMYYHFQSKDGLLAALVEPFVVDGQILIDQLEPLSGQRLPSRALAGYYDVVTKHLDVFRFVMADPSVRSHHLAGHRLADQASRFLGFLVGDEPSHSDVIRANAALGAIRRPLRLRNVDVADDRSQILASARAALNARS
jgi:AcrR family transcriptional regulator